jgi:hypothetical protein
MKPKRSEARRSNLLGFRTSIMTMHTGSLWSNGFHVAADSIVAMMGYLGQDKAVKIVMVIKAAASILIMFGKKLLSIARSPR